MNLEQKLRDFEESCLNSASKESEQVKEEIKTEIENQIKAELEDYTNRKIWNFNKTIEKLEKDYMKEIFYFQTDCKKQILAAKEDIYMDLKQNVKHRLEEYTEKEEYKNFLLVSIDKVLNLVENKNDISIGITSKDFSRYKDEIENAKNVKVTEIDNKYIGGCTLKSNEIYIDNTILNNLEEKMLQEKE